MSWIVFAICGWLVCSTIAAGTMFADFQGKFPRIAAEYYREDMGMSWLVGLVFGPIAVIVGIFLSGFWQHGWRIR